MGGSIISHRHTRVLLRYISHMVILHLFLIYWLLQNPADFFYNRGAHTNPCYAPAGISLTVNRQQGDTPTGISSFKVPAYGGGNFVDAVLKFVVVNAQASVMSFDPTHLHGTTVTCGTINDGYTFAFSKKIADSLAELDKEGRAHFGESHWGAGEGNLDYTG